MTNLFSTMNRSQRRDALAQLDRDNKKWPKMLTLVPTDKWPPYSGGPNPPKLVMRSSEFLVQVFDEPGGIIRLSVNRTTVDPATCDWHEFISWEEMQRLKNEAGFANFEAVEIFPPHDDVVNIANLRHLWVLPERLPFSWKRTT